MIKEALLLRYFKKFLYALFIAQIWANAQRKIILKKSPKWSEEEVIFSHLFPVRFNTVRNIRRCKISHQFFFLLLSSSRASFFIHSLSSDFFIFLVRIFVIFSIIRHSERNEGTQKWLSWNVILTEREGTEWERESDNNNLKEAVNC